MTPQIEAAWIAGGSGLLGVLVGVTGTVIVARLGFRNTRDATRATTDAAVATVQAQIEADRQNRIWEKRADVYTELITLVQIRNEVREATQQAVLAGTEPERVHADLDARGLQVRMIAYASPEVISAKGAAQAAETRYFIEVARWKAFIARDQATGGLPTPGPMTPDAGRKDATKALDEVIQLEAALVTLIRAELHAGAGDPPTEDQS